MLKLLPFGISDTIVPPMSTMGPPASYFPGLCALAHNDCLPGATGAELPFPPRAEFTPREVEGRSGRDDGDG